MPFGKFKGQTLSWVYEQEPSYLAWFHESVDGCEEVKEPIRGLAGIEAHLGGVPAEATVEAGTTVTAAAARDPGQQEVEWLMGKFSTETVDLVCEELFGGEE